MTIDIRIGDSRKLIHELPDASVDLVVTSPPYWGLRDYKTEPIIFDGSPDCEHEWGLTVTRKQSGGTDKATVYNNIDDRIHYEITTSFCSKCGAWRGQLGLEPTPELFIKHLLDFFDDVKPKLKAEGNCFVNLGDSYMGSGQDSGKQNRELSQNIGNRLVGEASPTKPPSAKKHAFLKPKCLCMIPQRFAWGMIERGWILRNSIIWYKPNHMPESVTDRLTKAHEVVYHFVKQQRYYYDLDVIREPQLGIVVYGDKRIRKEGDKSTWGFETLSGGSQSMKFRTENKQKVLLNPKGKNPGDVWQVTTQPYAEAHFATFPLELVRRPILAGCPENGTVLDPFAGSGTVGEFCRNHNRNAILFELNPDYKRLIVERTMSNIPSLESYEVKA